MACLGSVLYDPGTAATASGASLLAMTALDATNAQITFVAPASGNVLIRIRSAGKGATTSPQWLFGVIDTNGSVVKGRQAPLLSSTSGLATTTGVSQNEAVFLVTGLTGGTSYTYNGAYGVEFAVASYNLGWGGPDNATGDDAYGALCYEVWDAAGLLAGTLYDPSTAASASTATASAMATLDTTNLRLTFTVPNSGRARVILRCMGNGTSGTLPGVQLGVRDQVPTVKGRATAATYFCQAGTKATTDHVVFQSEFVVGGLSAGTSQTWDACWGTEHAVASTQLRWGGPNNTTQDDAYGGFAYEIWTA